jgi:TorA maturation chaperone TorD
MLDNRVYIYAFISKVFSNIMDKTMIDELKNSIGLLETIGDNAKNYILSKDTDELYEELNSDFCTIFGNAHPVESAVVDFKSEVLIGLENPIMQFYFNNGYEINMNNTHILAPDHISIEFGFVQNLMLRNENKTKKEFFDRHIMQWVPVYLIGIKNLASTTFYSDFFDFVLEFIMSEYYLLNSI